MAKAKASTNKNGIAYKNAHSATPPSQSTSANANNENRNLNAYGYADNLDYSVAISQAEARGEDTTQLKQERQNKIKHQYGGNEPTMFGSNQTYTQLSGAAASGNSGAQQTLQNALQFEAANGELYRNNQTYRDMYNAAAAGDWDAVGTLSRQLAQFSGQTDANGDPVFNLAEANRYNSQLKQMYGYNANQYYQGRYDNVYGEGAWDGGTGTGKPVYNEYSQALVNFYNQNNGQKMSAQERQALAESLGLSPNANLNIPTTGENFSGNSASGMPMPGGSSYPGSGGGSYNPGSYNPGSYNTGSLGDYLDQWLGAAKQQQINMIDYGTNQAVLDLIRQQQDAEAMFQEQRNQIAIDEAKAKDNQALYAESRGDKGGIGAAQYDSIMNTAAQNRLQVSQAQTKLATDTARQIADLRAQGEYEKADALLSLSQTYLSQLINLEQWAMEYNLSVKQFNASLQQWEAEYKLAVADLTGFYNGTPTLKYQQYQDELLLTQQERLAEDGWTLLSAGIPPAASQLAAMGITQDQANSYLTAAQLAAASGNKGNGGGGGGGGNPSAGGTDWSSVVNWIDRNGFSSAENYVKERYKELGYSSQSAALAGWSNYLMENATLDMIDESQLTNDYSSNAVKIENPTSGGTTITSWTSVQNMIDQGLARLRYNGDNTFTLVFTS